jgi:hypothetical protein
VDAGEAPAKIELTMTVEAAPALDARLTVGADLDELLSDQDFSRAFHVAMRSRDRALLQDSEGRVADLRLGADGRIATIVSLAGAAAMSLVREVAYGFTPARAAELQRHFALGAPVEAGLQALFGRVRRPSLANLWIELEAGGPQRRAYRPHGEGVFIVGVARDGSSTGVELRVGDAAAELERDAGDLAPWAIAPEPHGRQPVAVQGWGEALLVVRAALARPLGAREVERFAKPRLEILGEGARGFDRYVFTLEDRASVDPRELGGRPSTVLDAADLLNFVSRVEAGQLPGGEDPRPLRPIALAAARAALARCPTNGGPIPASDFRSDAGKAMAERSPERFRREAIVALVARLAS